MKLKSHLLVTILSVFISSVTAQKDTLFYLTVPDSLPTFVYGQDQLIRFIQFNIQYPEKAKVNKIEGKVYVSFVVDSFGKVFDPKVLKDIGGDCGEEAKRIIMATSGIWKPGLDKGKKVNVQITLPIKFTCDNCEVLKGSSGMVYVRDLELYYNKGVSELQAGRNLTAIYYFSEALSFNEAHKDALYNRGLARFRLNMRDAACFDWHEGKYRGDKGATDAINEYCAQTSATYFFDGYTSVDKKDYPTAITNFKKAIEIDSTGQCGSERKGKAHGELGYAFLRNHDTIPALSYLKHSIRLDPTTVHPRQNLAFLYSSMKNNTAAIEELNKLLVIDTSYSMAYMQKAFIYRDEKKYALAKENLVKALESDKISKDLTPEMREGLTKMQKELKKKK